MNKNIFFVLALGWFVVGCQSQPLFVDSQVGERTLDISGCTPYMGPMPECTGDENDPKVTINVDTLVVDPMCVNAKKGHKIEFKLDSASEIRRGSVVLYPEKMDDITWIIASNFPNKNKITIRVPKKKKSGAPFPTGDVKYGILTPTNCLDPRIHVVD